MFCKKALQEALKKDGKSGGTFLSEGNIWTLFEEKKKLKDFLS
jgi:hypothetical protein